MQSLPWKENSLTYAHTQNPMKSNMSKPRSSQKYLKVLKVKLNTLYLTSNYPLKTKKKILDIFMNIDVVSDDINLMPLIYQWKEEEEEDAAIKLPYKRWQHYCNCWCDPMAVWGTWIWKLSSFCWYIYILYTHIYIVITCNPHTNQELRNATVARVSISMQYG